MPTPKNATPKKTLSKTVAAKEAAALLEITVELLMHQRARGLAPGALGYKNKAHNLVWNRNAVTKKEQP